MRRIEFEVEGGIYRIEVDNEVLTMSQRNGGAWLEIARLTVAAATVLADLAVIEPRRTLLVARSRIRATISGDSYGGDRRRRRPTAAVNQERSSLVPSSRRSVTIVRRARWPSPHWSVSSPAVPLPALSGCCGQRASAVGDLKLLDGAGSDNQPPGTAGGTTRAARLRDHWNTGRGGSRGLLARPGACRRSRHCRRAGGRSDQVGAVTGMPLAWAPAARRVS